MLSKFHALLFVLVALAVAVSPAYSTTVTTYSSLSTWQAAASGIQTIDFSGKAGTSSGALIVGGVQFIGYTSNSYPPGSESIYDTSTNSWVNFGSGLALYINTSGTTTLPHIQITLPTPVTAAGLNLFTYASVGLSLTVTVAGTSFTVPTFSGPAPSAPFFGVTSDTPFSTIDVSLPSWSANPNAWEFVDNVRFGTAAATDTPEAATCLLIGSGLIGLGMLRRRISRNQAADALAA